MDKNWIFTRFIGFNVIFDNGTVKIENCKILSWNKKGYTLDKVDGYIPIEYLYLNKSDCLATLE